MSFQRSPGTAAPPLLFTRPGQNMNQFAIPIAILFAIGAYAPMLVTEARAFRKAMRQRRLAGTVESSVSRS